ncbi:MAG: sulfatase-like hydrolase/transferase [Myxococcota bacterium]|nr:sulfatase-like hydrolase/transferase [Myxococcota bacterium]
MTTRRTLLKNSAILGAGTLSGALRPARAARSDRPNILVIMSDEHDGGVLGCMGNDIISTPHIDSIADEGIRLPRCYAAAPVCGPTRLALTGGKYSSRLRVWGNNSRLPSGPTIASLMNRAGYQSILCGKQHYAKGKLHGFAEIGGQNNKHEKTGYEDRRDPDDESINTASRDERFARFEPGRSSGILNHDDRLTDTTVSFLKDRRAEDPPFFYFLGYKAPHFPLTVPRRYWRKYRGKVPMPNIPAGSVASQPLNYHHLRRAFGVVETDPTLVRRGRELYYGLISWLDNEIGRVLKALAGSEVAENTVVIFTSDHGENKGDHHLWWKNCMYEHATRVPLLVRWPQRWRGGQVRRGACSTLDVVQTILALGGASTPGDFDGDSLLPWLDDKKHAWKDLAVSEYYAHNVCSGFSMIRSGPHKYVYHTEINSRYGSERELYDLSTDPGELNNLAVGSAAICERLHRAMVAELGAEPDELEQQCRSDYSRARR